MSTATSRVELALNILGVHSAINPARPELINECFEQLKVTIDRLYSIGLDLEIVTPENLADELGNPTYSDAALSYQLALDFEGIARKPLSATDRLTAARLMRQLRSRLFSMGAPKVDGFYGQGNSARLNISDLEYMSQEDPGGWRDIKKEIRYYKSDISQISIKINWDEIKPATITSSEWFLEIGITLDSNSLTDRETTAIISGGKLLTEYEIGNVVTLSTGEKKRKTVYLSVVKDS